MLTFPLGPIVFTWYPAGGLGWAVRKWRYFEKTSWRHGTAYLGRLKVVW